MAKPTKKELLEAMKDPELLKSAGLQPITDEEEKDLFSDITLGENDTMEDMVRKINDKTRKQRDYLRKREEKILTAAEDKAGEGERIRRQKEVDSFLEEHPELSNNKTLLGKVDQLYTNGTPLQEAWEFSCRGLGLDIKTGKAPESGEDKKDDTKPPAKKEEKEVKKTSSLKSDTIDSGLPGVREAADDSRPKSIREIAGEISNDLAAKGTNPFRDS